MQIIFSPTQIQSEIKDVFSLFYSREALDYLFLEITLWKIKVTNASTSMLIIVINGITGS